MSLSAVRTTLMSFLDPTPLETMLFVARPASLGEIELFSLIFDRVLVSSSDNLQALGISKRTNIFRASRALPDFPSSLNGHSAVWESRQSGRSESAEEQLDGSSATIVLADHNCEISVGAFRAGAPRHVGGGHSQKSGKVVTQFAAQSSLALAGSQFVIFQENSELRDVIGATVRNEIARRMRAPTGLEL